MSLPGLQPKVKPVLHEIQSKDPVEQENKNRVMVDYCNSYDTYIKICIYFIIKI